MARFKKKKKRPGSNAGWNLSQRDSTNGSRSTQVRKETAPGTKGSGQLLLCQHSHWRLKGHIRHTGGKPEAEQSDLLLDFRAKSSGYLCRLEFETRSIKNFNIEICKSCSEIHQTGARRMYSINSPCRNLNLTDFFVADNYAVN